MKLINRSKFLTDKDCGVGVYNEKRGEHPDRIYECDHNRYIMTVLESIWLYPEYSLVYGKYRKPNIWWFLLGLFCPWYKTIYDAIKYDGWNLPIFDFILLIIICCVVLCGLGPIACVVVHYNWIRGVHKKYKKRDFGNDEDFEKYKTIKLF